jgi:hypothetical protein
MYYALAFESVCAAAAFVAARRAGER